jgi:hypothetical protein
MQYFIESVLPIILLLAFLIILLVILGALAGVKIRQIFISIRKDKAALKRSESMTRDQRHAIRVYADAIAAMVAELSAPNKNLILGTTISEDVQSLLYEAHALRAKLPALTREDRA